MFRVTGQETARGDLERQSFVARGNLTRMEDSLGCGTSPYRGRCFSKFHTSLGNSSYS